MLACSLLLGNSQSRGDGGKSHGRDAPLRESLPSPAQRSLCNVEEVQSIAPSPRLIFNQPDAGQGMFLSRTIPHQERRDPHELTGKRLLQ